MLAELVGVGSGNNVERAVDKEKKVDEIYLYL